MMVSHGFSDSHPSFVIAGRLQRDTLLPMEGRPLINVPGGNLLHAAAGLTLWEQSDASSLQPRHGTMKHPEALLGLLARVGNDYPREWLHLFQEHGWDTAGIHILDESLETRFFQVTMEDGTTLQSDPLAHFARLGLPFPKYLIGYQTPGKVQHPYNAPLPSSPRPSDIPSNYPFARAVHLCPLDYLTGCRLASTFREAGTTTLTIDPGMEYMNRVSFQNARTLLNGLTAFLPSEEELRSLFWGQTDDLWQMAEEIGECGCEFVIIKRGEKGQMLYDAVAHKRWEVPAYPVRMVDPIGIGDAFCGGFLAGYQHGYDPLQGVLQGSISSSLKLEGSGVFHLLETMPGLAERRLEALRNAIRQV
jgi:ribokinase